MQHDGIIGTIIDAEQKVADQGEKVWKKLPGVSDKKRKCQIHLEVSVQMITLLLLACLIHYPCQRYSSVNYELRLPSLWSEGTHQENLID